MDILKRKLGRRKFLSASSVALGAGMLARPSRMFAAEGVQKKAAANIKADGTKYGNNIILSTKNEATERGIATFKFNAVDYTFPGFSTAIIGRMPPPGPMPGHDGSEKHDGEVELLIHLGNNRDDPLDLGADVNFYLGRGKWMEHYQFNRATAVYLPDGMWHCPWKVEKIRTEMTWVNIRMGGLALGGQFGEGLWDGTPPSNDQGRPGGEQGVPSPMSPPKGLSEEEQANAKTCGYIFDKYLLSGVGAVKDPKGGKWIAYTDCTKISGGKLIRIIRYNPEEAPYSIIDTQTHEYATLFILLGTDLNDCTDLGAEVEFSIGPEKEKHTISKSAIVYVPANTEHGPFNVQKADNPFNFLEIVAGPELPGAVYKNEQP